MKTFRTAFIFAVSLLCLTAFRASAQPSLTSDKPDYAPGEIAFLSGAGFQPGETIELVVLVEPDTLPDTEGSWSWVTTADNSGAFTAAWQVCWEGCAGATLRATADGVQSGLHAECMFTDAPIPAYVTVTASPSCALGGSFRITYKPPTGNNVTVTGTTPETFEVKTNSDFTITLIQASVNGNSYTGSATLNGSSGGDLTTTTATLSYSDGTAPNLVLNGSASMTVECHDSFSDPGATASDLCAGDLTGQIQVSGSVDPNTPSSYTLTYSVNDGNGNSNSVQRTVNVVDTTPPSVLLNGSASMTVECHDSFSDPGATASDLCAGDLTGQIQVSGSVDPNTPGSYTLTYSVNDGNGNSNSVQRTVNVVDTTAPSVLLNGSASMTVECHDTFSDPGATASDLCAGDLTGQIQVSGSVDPNTPSSYTLTYSVNDGNGNSNSVQRTVNVVDTTPPSVLLNGSASMTVECHDSFSDPGATASDLCAGDLTGQIQVSGSVDPNTPGSYTLTYSVNDGNGNSNSVQRTVNVIDTTAPSVLLNGSASMTVECHDTFSDPGATASDLCAGDLTGQIQVSGSVDPNTPGSYTLTYSVNDGNGNSNSVQRTVNVVDTTVPVLTAPGAVNRTTSADATSCGLVIPDADLGTASATDVCAGVLLVDRSGVPSGNLFPVGTTVLTYSAMDPSGNPIAATQNITVTDGTPPTMTPIADIVRLPDAGTCSATVTFAAGANDNCSGVAVVASPPSGSSFPLGTTLVTCTATDGAGNQTTATFSVTILNPAPVATITGPASGSIFPIDVPVSLSGMFTDNAGDIHTAAWSLDGITTPGTVDEALKTVSGSYTFTAPGIYFVSLTVTDQCGGSSTATRVGAFDAMVVIYDPNAGFVTGGGWINSPAGALAANPSLAGRANFGFVSKYKKGASAPTGETEFQFRLGNLNFHSTEYNWLVVSGAKAQFKGSGTINGASDYGFLLSAVDGQLSGGGGMDKFRMKIVDKLTGAVIYDNQMGAPDSSSATTLVAGGSIVIHNSAKGNTSTSGEMVEMGLQSPSGFLLAQNSPNPFRGATQVHFALSQSSRVRLTVYDVSGREIMTLAEGEWAAGNHTVIWSGRTRDGNAARAGVYFARLAAEPQDGKPFTAMRKMLLIN